MAICEQIEDPAEARKRGAKSPVKRDVVRLVTAGTITEDDLLPARGANYLAALALLRHGEDDFALAYADVSTGDLAVIALTPETVGDELARIAPAELLLTQETEAALRQRKIATEGAVLVRLATDIFDSNAASRQIADQFAAGAVDPTSFARAERCALGALLFYIRDSQKGVALALRAPVAENVASYLAIDASSRASLELFETQRGERKGSLLGIIDTCVTPPGSRLLARRLAAPLLDPAALNARLDAVSELRDRDRELRAVRGRGPSDRERRGPGADREDPPAPGVARATARIAAAGTGCATVRAGFSASRVAVAAPAVGFTTPAARGCADGCPRRRNAGQAGRFARRGVGRAGGWRARGPWRVGLRAGRLSQGGV